MNFYIDAREFSDALNQVKPAIPGRPTHPILASVKLETGEDSLHVTGFDLSTLISVVAPIDNHGDKKTACIPHRLLSDIVSRLSGRIELMVQDEHAIITSDTGSYKVPVTNANEYPDGVDVENEPITLDAEILSSAIATVIGSASDDPTKQILTGVNLVSDGQTLQFSATNGHRLAQYTTDTELNKINVTIPASAIGIFSRQHFKTVELALSDTLAKFTISDENLTIVTRVIDGQYPNVNQLIPVKFERIAQIEKSALKSALSRLQVLTDDKNNLIKMAFEKDSDGGVLLLSVDSQDGSGSEALVIDYNGDDFKVAFNIKYMLHGLNSLAGNTISFKCNQPNQPAVMASETPGLYLMMPVQIVKL